MGPRWVDCSRLGSFFLRVPDDVGDLRRDPNFDNYPYGSGDLQ